MSTLRFSALPSSNSEFDGNLGIILLKTDFAHGNSKYKLETNVDKFVYEYDEPGEYEIPFQVRMSQLPEDDFTVKVNVNYDTLSESIEYPVSIKNVKVDNINQNLENFQAILTFDYNSSKLSQINRDLLKQLSERLPEGATIQILGSADALGSAQRNIELENERAENTMNYIKSVSGDKFDFKTGRSSFKFREDTPQGRMLNRSIRIRVQK
jgi:outer membrane protein OmpA-like peptidoglycan-associated protein